MSLPEVIRQAEGRWYGILTSLGFSEAQLNGKNQPCPWCGGKDRFRWSDRSKGMFYCSNCGHGDGLDMLMRNGYSMGEALTEVERLVCITPKVKKVNLEDEVKQRLNRIWTVAKHIEEGDEAWMYLTGRGLIPAQFNLRFHPSLPYTGEQRFPAMVAKVMSAEGKPTAIHRTYLKDGRKAPVESPKKIMGRLGEGAAIRLFPAAETLGIAEGIETAIAASMRFGIPVWSSISANGMEKWIPPGMTKKVVIFGDCDESFTGQAAAYSLAFKLKKTVDVEVKIPQKGDWADEQP